MNSPQQTLPLAQFVSPPTGTKLMLRVAKYSPREYHKNPSHNMYLHMEGYENELKKFFGPDQEKYRVHLIGDTLSIGATPRSACPYKEFRFNTGSTENTKPFWRMVLSSHILPAIALQKEMAMTTVVFEWDNTFKTLTAILPPSSERKAPAQAPRPSSLQVPQQQTATVLDPTPVVQQSIIQEATITALKVKPLSNEVELQWANGETCGFDGLTNAEMSRVIALLAHRQVF